MFIGCKEGVFSLAYFWVLLAGILWGTVGTVQSFLPSTVEIFSISAVRAVIAGFSMLSLLIVLKKISFRNWPWLMTIFATVCITIFQLLFLGSVRLTGVALASVVSISTAPVFSGIIEWVYSKQCPSRIWGISTAFAIIGAVLLFMTPGNVQVNTTGVLYALIAGFVFAFYTLATKNVVKKVDALPMIAVIFSISAILISPFLFMYDITWMKDVKNLSIMLYLGFGTTVFAYVLYSQGLKKIPASSALTLSLAEPTTAALLGVFLLGEVFSFTSWVGIVLLLGGIVVLTVGAQLEVKKKYAKN